MRCRSRELLLGTVLLWVGRTAGAQQRTEVGVQSVATLSRQSAVVAGGYGALRTSGRTRLSLDLGVGLGGSDLVWRAEALGHFLFSPEERRKPGFYIAGGLAAAGGDTTHGYLVLTLGLEQRPQSRSGWALEAGVGGGVRLVGGYRWRFESLTSRK
jgi:hypothetical protein